MEFAWVRRKLECTPDGRASCGKKVSEAVQDVYVEHDVGLGAEKRSWAIEIEVRGKGDECSRRRGAQLRKPRSTEEAQGIQSADS